MKSTLYSLFFLFITQWGFSQILHSDMEIGASVATNSQTPFWLHANRYGEVPMASPFLLGRIGINKSYVLDSNQNYKNKWFGWSTGLRGVLNLSAKGSFNFSEAYINARLWKVEISVGRHKDSVGIIEPELSTGNYSFSANTLPMPKISIASIGFIEVPYTKELLAFKFNYADGNRGPSYGGKDGQQYLFPETYLHQKSLYARIGKPSWKWNFYGGFCHQAIWGSEKVYTNGGFPYDKWRTYRGVIVGESWYSSRIGNHVANIDFGVSYQTGKYVLKIYKQAFVEDGSLTNDFLTFLDGLYGANLDLNNYSYKQYKIRKLLFEVLYTYRQGGPDFVIGTNTQGRDNYFNHYLYFDGWSYKGRTLGTPMIAPSSTMRPELLEKGRAFTNNNRLLLFHLGLKGTAYDKYDFILKTSLSRNAGTYDIPINPQRWQFSGLLEIKTKLKKFKNTEAVGMFATDLGGIYPNNAGIYVALRKSGSFF